MSDSLAFNVAGPFKEIPAHELYRFQLIEYIVQPTKFLEIQ